MRKNSYVLIIGSVVLSSAIILTSCSLGSEEKSSVESTLGSEMTEDSLESTSEVTEMTDDTEISVSETETAMDIHTSLFDIYRETNIVFEEGEAELCVKNNIGLPTTISDATITWVSDNPEIIENDGTLHRPEDYSPLVNMTATITNDEGTLEKTFELRVIKTELDDMKPEDVWTLDEVDQIYFFNDIIEDTHIYINEEGYVTRVIGSIFEYKVDSPDEAMLALYGLEKVLGCQSVYDEFVIDHIVKDDYGYTFVFNQVYKSYPVSGYVLSVTTDLEGNTNGLVSYYHPIDVSTDYSISEQEAIDKIEEYESIAHSELQLMEYEGEMKMMWKVYYNKADGLQYVITIDANTGEVISDFLNGQID